MQFFDNFDLRCKMIQCKDCEFYQTGADGRRIFKCDPFSNIKEPECLAKWQLLRLDMLVASYQSMLQWYKELSPLQDKILKYMKREIEDMEDSESWKLPDEQDHEDQQDLGQDLPPGI